MIEQKQGRLAALVNTARKLTMKGKKKTAQEWSYNEESTSPKNWGKIGYDISATGKKQSPIDIITAETGNGSEENKKKLEILSAPSSDGTDLLNTKFTFKAVWNNNEAHIKLDEEEYKLVQFHCHSPSEHSVDGKYYDVELHLVHSHVNDPSKLTVLGVFFNRGDDESEFFSQFLGDVPHKCGEEVKDKDISLADLNLEGGYWRYDGSLTTPPCSECVSWIVLKNVHTLSSDQFERYTKIFNEDTNRPVQPLHDRKVLSFD